MNLRTARQLLVVAFVIAAVCGSIVAIDFGSEKIANWWVNRTHQAVDTSGALKKLEDSRIAFEEQRAAAEEQATEMDEAHKASVRLQEAISRLNDAKAEAEIRRLELEEARALAGWSATHQ